MKVDGGADAAERPAVPFGVLDHAVSIAVHASLVLFAMFRLCFCARFARRVRCRSRSSGENPVYGG